MNRYFSCVVADGSSGFASVELASDTVNEPPQQKPSSASEEVLQSIEGVRGAIMDDAHTQLTKRRQKGYEKFTSEIKRVTGLTCTLVRLLEGRDNPCVFMLVVAFVLCPLTWCLRQACTADDPLANVRTV